MLMNSLTVPDTHPAAAVATLRSPLTTAVGPVVLARSLTRPGQLGNQTGPGWGQNAVRLRRNLRVVGVPTGTRVLRDVVARPVVAAGARVRGTRGV
jgi:hypothetical protein